MLAFSFETTSLRPPRAIVLFFASRKLRKPGGLVAAEEHQLALPARAGINMV
jgi:hypothetical protein